MGGQKLKGPQLREVNYEASLDLKASPRGLPTPKTTVAEPAGSQHGTCRLVLGACCTDVMEGVYTLLVAIETVEREGAFPWHCSLLWVMKAGKELNCFLHFPHRNTSSSSAIRETGHCCRPSSVSPSATFELQPGKARKHLIYLSISRILSGDIRCNCPSLILNSA